MKPLYNEDNDPIMIHTDGFSKYEASPQPGGRRRPPAEMLHLLSAVIVWLVTGTTISSLNKWIFAVYNFRYPLLLSALHMLTAIVVDYGLIKLRVIRHAGLLEQDLTPGAKCKVFLLSLTFCASIAFGNMGLNYVQLSFAQMIYTTTPLFTLAISTLILGKQHHILKYTAMMPICLGASFSIMGEVQYDQTGCLFVIAATMFRGVKSIQQSILLQEEKINSVFLLYLMSIPSFCILAVAALALENWALLEWPLHYDQRLWVFILLSCLGSVLYNLASSCVITLTSAVTLHILGNLSVVGNLLLSQLLFGSELSALSCAGAVLTLSGRLQRKMTATPMWFFFLLPFLCGSHKEQQPCRNQKEAPNESPSKEDLTGTGFMLCHYSRAHCFIRAFPGLPYQIPALALLHYYICTCFPKHWASRCSDAESHFCMFPLSLHSSQ
ncbi:solute carrier family 35 member E4 isoform X2 [Syngnathoides biaculeatus]|uniref:solute carrier family 35 member E4 isoform X2 n=1 Tax=Syngnathoides biaculeatus TaxID=300417 RepID=UPI002ADE5D03|nr:solute carrier family 35 member E4 isoform X2 [Syngnathoides biaculeatus]